MGRRSACEMMDCSTAKSKIFPFADGELTPELCDQLEAHLARCGACRRLVDLEVAFRETYVERLRPDPAPEPVRERVATLLRGLGEGRRAGRGWRRVERLAVCAGAVLLLVVGLGAGIVLQSYTGTRTSLAELADAAVEQHQKLVRDLLPPDIKDVSPKVAEEWFKKRLAFNVSLPELKTERLHFLGGPVTPLPEVEAAAPQDRVHRDKGSLFIIPGGGHRPLPVKDKPPVKVGSHPRYEP